MRRPVLLSLLTLVAAETSFAQAPAISNPFSAPAASPGTAAATQDGIEFAGMSEIGKEVHFVFVDKAAKKSRWVKEGETTEGISIVRYDPRVEQVTIRYNGSEKTLSMRKAAGTPRTPGHVVAPLTPAAGFAVPGPAPLPMPAAPQPATVADNGVQVGAPAAIPAPSAPQTPQAKAETEARMLVSDLLEIGMAQRKAYEEAQRKAAAGPEATPPPAAR